MRILFLEQFSELGGGQRNLLDLLPGFREQGMDARVGAPGDGPLFERVRALGADAVRIPFENHTAARFPGNTLRLARWIAKTDADLISVGGARLLWAAALGARGRTVIFQALHFFENPRDVKLAGWAIRQAGMPVVANSEYVARQFRRYAGVRVVYQGVEEIPFARRKIGSEWRIGLIGRIAPMKGQADFLRAAHLIPGARFVICGSPMFSPNGYMNEVRRLAEGLPVEFTGWSNDVGAVLRELDLMVVPSSAAEATTRVALEAFSAGVPVVAYAAGGIPEIVRDGENGFLVPERSPAALARRVKDAMSADLDAIARRARADWEARYTVARYRREMMEAYRPFMGPRGAVP